MVNFTRKLGLKPRASSTAFGIILMVGNPLVVACSDSLNQKVGLRTAKYWVAKAKKNIARGNK
jgi:hypothetical protein